MKYQLSCDKKDMGVFKDLFRYHYALFKDVKLEVHEDYGTVWITFAPRFNLFANKIYEVFKAEKSMGTEFEIYMCV